MSISWNDALTIIIIFVQNKADRFEKKSIKLSSFHFRFQLFFAKVLLNGNKTLNELKWSLFQN